MTDNLQKHDEEQMQKLVALANKIDVDTVFDVGAYRGLVTDAMRIYFPNARYFLFEPQPSRSVDLVRKYKNDCNISVRELVLRDTVGQSEFYVGKFAPTSSIKIGISPFGKHNIMNIPFFVSFISKPSVPKICPNFISLTLSS